MAGTAIRPRRERGRNCAGPTWGRKLSIYAREQVAHVWLVDPVVRAEPFTEIALALASLWAD
jgi:hypothetical protein